jgi:hypothetical protein
MFIELAKRSLACNLPMSDIVTRSIRFCIKRGLKCEESHPEPLTEIIEIVGYDDLPAELIRSCIATRLRTAQPLKNDRQLQELYKMHGKRFVEV